MVSFEGSSLFAFQGSKGCAKLFILFFYFVAHDHNFFIIFSALKILAPQNTNLFFPFALEENIAKDW